MPKIINKLEENILAAARRLVAEQGYAAVTMRAIAKECGIAVGTFYNYYPSKDAMLAACLLHDWQTALASAGERTAAAQSAEEAVGAVFDAVRAFQEPNRSIFSDEGARPSAAGAPAAESGYALSQRIWGAFSSRTESRPFTTPAWFSFRYGPQDSSPRAHHSSSMKAVSSSTVT